MMPRLAVVALSAMALLASGCGDDSDETSASGGGSSGTSSSVASVTSAASASASISSSSSSSTSSTNSSGSSGGAGGGTCNELTQEGEVVVAVADTASPPSPTGGDIIDGVYILTSLAFLESDSVPIPLSTAISAQILGLDMQSVTTDSEGVVTHTTTSLEVDGVNLTMVQTCSSPPSEQIASDFTFSASPTELTLYSSLGGIVIEQR